MRRFDGELPGSQIFFEIDGGERLAVEKSLRFFATFAKQKLGLCLRLDTFGDDLKPEIVGHDNQRTHNRGGIGAMILRTKLRSILILESGNRVR